MTNAHEITTENLNSLIGRPDAPTLIDVSIDPDFEEDPFLIPGAFRHPYKDFTGIMDRLHGTDAVIICQKGGKLSQGCASWLRSEGVAARYLLGGNHAWRDTPGVLRVPALRLPAHGVGKSLWVTSTSLGPNRLASTWLVRRFLDPSARVLFVADAERDGVSERYGATAFEDFATKLAPAHSHVTFEAMVQHFTLNSSALNGMADALTDGAPEAVGITAILNGIGGRETSAEARATAALPIFDALFLQMQHRVIPAVR